MSTKLLGDKIVDQVRIKNSVTRLRKNKYKRIRSKRKRYPKTLTPVRGKNEMGL